MWSAIATFCSTRSRTVPAAMYLAVDSEHDHPPRKTEGRFFQQEQPWLAINARAIATACCGRLTAIALRNGGVLNC
jgi:hypothetical protein